jgi:hypothetical protein
MNGDLKKTVHKATTTMQGAHTQERAALKVVLPISGDTYYEELGGVHRQSFGAMGGRARCMPAPSGKRAIPNHLTFKTLSERPSRHPFHLQKGYSDGSVTFSISMIPSDTLMRSTRQTARRTLAEARRHLHASHSAMTANLKLLGPRSSVLRR